MSEQVQQNEQENKTETIPKQEHETKLKEMQSTLDSLKSELEKRDLQLLDPDYIKYRKSKTEVIKDKYVPRKPAEPLDKEDDAYAKIQAHISELNEKLTNSQQTLSDLLAVNELNETKSRYPDFETYKEDILNVLKNSKTELTYEQAYLIAKSYKETTPTQGKTVTQPKGSEKPTGSVPAKSIEAKRFKSDEEANQATLAALKEKYPDLGDTI